MDGTSVKLVWYRCLAECVLLWVRSWKFIYRKRRGEFLIMTCLADVTKTKEQRTVDQMYSQNIWSWA